MLVLLLILTALQAYVIGSVNGAIIISKYFYKKDIRNFGSGNAGLTNFYRVFGKGGAVLVVLIDVLKTVAPVIIGGLLFSHFIDAAYFKGGNVGLLRLSFFGSEYAGFFVMLGHCYPLFYSFRAERASWQWARSCFLSTGALRWPDGVRSSCSRSYPVCFARLDYRCAAYPVAQALFVWAASGSCSWQRRAPYF